MRSFPALSEKQRFSVRGPVSQVAVGLSRTTTYEDEGERGLTRAECSEIVEAERLVWMQLETRKKVQTLMNRAPNRPRIVPESARDGLNHH
jgi:hypothetical protein